ncbi:hypothetical protein CAPTEDRAFT_226375 [Capitella teleta]|uniref:Uncharacterized protein n=1 Tax=Capitella teleta TaxID=283909 RepID=R7VAE2_CAPTE|nr:hypothetical protein CAPTEDRAFT_226375 [Capitella teleta]|eukprot:ELU13301.1 hypothetical protein CAPTEDRAFT_226375 [Capitella teleta]
MYIILWYTSTSYCLYACIFMIYTASFATPSVADASSLPSIGITDFEHIKIITKGFREQMLTYAPFWNRSISLVPKEALGMYLEKKCMTGERSNDLTYKAFLRNIEEYK